MNLNKNLHINVKKKVQMNVWKISCNFSGHPKAQLTQVEGDLFEECQVSAGEIWCLSAAELILGVH